jgi:anaerobic C4-dicarboxylate transporter
MLLCLDLALLLACIVIGARVGGIGVFPEARPACVKIGEAVTEIGQVEMGRMLMIVMTVATLVPIGLAPGRPAHAVVGAYTAANGTFFLPTCGTILAAVSLDRTGSTRIGSFLLGHSFLRQGLVATAVTAATAPGLARWLLT